MAAGRHHFVMPRTPTDARRDVVQAAVIALIATLPPDRTDLTRTLILAGVADLDERHASGTADAAAAGTLAAVLGSLAR